MKSALVLLAVLVAVQGSSLRFEPEISQNGAVLAANNKWTPPKFCNKLDCPEYTVVSKTTDYEVRTYKKSSWVSTNMNGVDYDEASYQLFRRLYKYISGNNKQKTKIDMTAPVRTRIIPGQGPACENNFTMSFFVSPSEGSKVPEPSDSDVRITTLEEMTVFVREFSGFTFTIKTWLEEAAKLAQAVQRDGGKYVQDHYFIAGYDSPFKFWNRHNEIWFIKV